MRQWQPPPSQWPATVTNPPDLWHSMDRPWVQEQFPEMNIICSPSITGNQLQSDTTTSTRSETTPAADAQNFSYCQLLASDSPSLSGQISSNLTSPNQNSQEKRTNSTMISATEKPQEDEESIP
ncbi:hypothetical protein FSP39_019560 [Pinctada imbricata]|uniref:Uncharacterized protein n=1 Tax=Pinctada imbricata TaxID=66713 RepID=A0AA88Y4Q1_PINIB|nr:hypothetical protein FSP39_019560 [Pinctada imbricata]